MEEIEKCRSGAHRYVINKFLGPNAQYVTRISNTAFDTMGVERWLSW